MNAKINETEQAVIQAEEIANVEFPPLPKNVSFRPGDIECDQNYQDSRPLYSSIVKTRTAHSPSRQQQPSVERHFSSQQTADRHFSSYSFMPRGSLPPSTSHCFTLGTARPTDKPSAQSKLKGILKHTAEDKKIDSAVHEPTDAELEQLIPDYGFTIGDHLTADERKQLLKVIFKHRGLFARSIADHKIFDGYEAHINLKPDAKPYFGKQYKMPLEHRQLINDELLKMKAVGIIEDSHEAQWSNPLFCVLKKTTPQTNKDAKSKGCGVETVPKPAVRLVMDCRQNNLRTIPEQISLPCCQDILREACSMKPYYITTLDLQSAFHSVKYDRESRKYMSFRSPLDGQCYSFCTLVQGHVSSSSHLSKALSIILSSVIAKLKIWIYADDILIVAEKISFRSI